MGYLFRQDSHCWCMIDGKHWAAPAHWQKPHLHPLGKRLMETRKGEGQRVPLGTTASSLCSSWGQFKMRKGVTSLCHTSIDQKCEREGDTQILFEPSATVHYKHGFPAALCLFCLSWRKKKNVGIMPRAPTLLSLTFKNQHSPIRIFKNFIFLVIHNTKAALHFSCNPGWQNSTKTHFLEQKVSFSLYID